MSSQDLHYHRGSQIKLRCEVSRGPLYSSSLEWRVSREGRQTVLNTDTTRGGVFINTAREDGEDSRLVRHTVMYYTVMYYRENQNSVSSYSGLDIRTRLL